GGQRFLSANGCSPDAFINGIFRLFKIHLNAVFLQELNFSFPGKLQVADGSDDLRIRKQYLEDHVETDLVVPGAGTSMRDGAGFYFLRIVGDGDGLGNSFGADRKRISVVLQDIPEDQVTDTAFVIAVCCIDALVAGRPQFQGAFFDVV